MRLNRMTTGRAFAPVCALAVLVVAVAAFPGSAGGRTASAMTATDPTDTPSGPEGKTDLRSLKWDVAIATTTQTISVDESRYRINEQRARLGLHVLLDTDRDGIADAEVAGTRNIDGISMDIALRSLDRAQSIGATLDLRSEPGAGTRACLTASIPAPDGMRD